MTLAQEKAKELIIKFHGFTGASGEAKFAAIECVNEILCLKMVYNMGRDDNYNEGTFYEEVKQELLKM